MVAPLQCLTMLLFSSQRFYLKTPGFKQKVSCFLLSGKSFVSNTLKDYSVLISISLFYNALQATKESDLLATE